MVELKRVLVGLDGSAAAAGAARWAAEAVRDSGGEVIAVHAAGASPELVTEATVSAGYGLGFFSDGGERAADLSHRLVERWCRPLRDAGVPYRTVISEQDPVHALLDTARQEDVDLIVIGHRGQTGLLQRLFHGLSDQLVDHARRPVGRGPLRPVARPRAVGG
jgi:nucleotide-binding universal stress UspA family protein